MSKCMIGFCLLVFMALIFGTMTRIEIVADYEYEKNFQYAWNLADKSSTIDAKSKYISEFVEKIEAKKDDFAKNSAVWLKTSDNSFDKNLDALKSLRDRLLQIKTMDPQSFQYNTAIQQITAQEQGEAGPMLDVLKSCWVLENHSMICGWHGCLMIVLAGLLLLIAVGFFVAARDGY